MLKVKGLRIRFPKSTALALASAAFALGGRAAMKNHNQKQGRLYIESSRHVAAFEGADAEAWRAALETLRSSPEARAEALRAIELVYPNEAPFECCIVQAFHRDVPFRESVCLNHPEEKFV